MYYYFQQWARASPHYAAAVNRHLCDDWFVLSSTIVVVVLLRITLVVVTVCLCYDYLRNYYLPSIFIQTKRVMVLGHLYLFQIILT